MSTTDSHPQQQPYSNVTAGQAAPKVDDTVTFTAKRNESKQGIVAEINHLPYSGETEYIVNVDGILYAVYPDQVTEVQHPAAPVGEDPSAPKASLAIGDTVTFRFNTDSTLKGLFTGDIVDAKKSIVLGSVMYRVRPHADDRLAYLEPVWVMPYQIEGVVAVEDQPYDQMPALKAIEAAFVAWEEAYFAGRYEEAGRLSAIHDRLFDAHMDRLFPKQGKTTNAPSSNDSAPTAPSAPSQVTSIDNAIHQPEMPVERVLEGSRRTGVVTYCDHIQGYGYIKANETGEKYYFQWANRMYQAMPIERGDKVTFEEKVISAESAAGPKALNILVDGYTPAPRPEYQPSPALKAAAAAVKQARRQSSVAQRRDRIKAQQGNIARLSQLTHKNA